MNMQSHDRQMPIMEHLIELRNRLTWAVLALFITFGACYYFVEDIYGFLVRPLAEIMGPDRRMIYTALTEVFFTYVKVSFFAACFVSAPVFLGQFWAFVAPGLYKNERSAFMPFLFATPILSSSANDDSCVGDLGQTLCQSSNSFSISFIDNLFGNAWSIKPDHENDGSSWKPDIGGDAGALLTDRFLGDLNQNLLLRTLFKKLIEKRLSHLIEIFMLSGQVRF